MRTYRTLLAEGSSTVHRAYLNHDYRPQFTPVERDWYARLGGALDFFDRFPFDDLATATAQYARRVRQIERLAGRTELPARLGEEMLYHFILREATAIVVNVRMDWSLMRSGHLFPDGSYSTFPPPAPSLLDREPDVRESLAWARRALRSIAADGWLLITWQVMPDGYNLSLH